MNIELELKLYKENNKETTVNDKVVKDLFTIIDGQGHSGFSYSYLIGWVNQIAKDNKELQKLIALNHKAKENKEHKEDSYMQGLITRQIITITDYLQTKCNKEEKKVALELLNDKPLTPLTGADDEWGEADNYKTEEGLEVLTYQNLRRTSVFKDVFPNGIEIAHDIDNTIYSDNGGINWFTTGRYPRKQITFPYTPKPTEHVYLYEYSEHKAPYILTDPDTIKQLKELKEIND